MQLRASRRRLWRARDARLRAVREFADRRGWKVQGLFGDLSSRYPVAPLAGAWSAQAELGVTGSWGEWPAFVVLVLVLPKIVGPSEPRGHRDIVVQLTGVEAGPNAQQFTAVKTKFGVDVTPLTDVAPEQLALLRKTLTAADWQDKDRVAFDAEALVHTRVIRPTESTIDIEGPLRTLGELAGALAL